MSTTRRELWQLTLPLPAVMTLLHDFSNEVPTGGYPSSRVQVSADLHARGRIPSRGDLIREVVEQRHHRRQRERQLPQLSACRAHHDGVEHEVGRASCMERV